MTFQDGLQTAVLIRWSPNGQRLGFVLECKLGVTSYLILLFSVNSVPNLLLSAIIYTLNDPTDLERRYQTIFFVREYWS